MTERPRSECRRAAVSSSESGERRIVDELTFPPPQPGRRDEQLRAGGADDEQRNAARPVHEIVDEVEQCLVGPMQVLEDEDERALLRERFQEPAPGRERLAVLCARRRCLGVETGEGTKVPFHPPGLGLVRQDRLHGLVELVGRLARAL